MELLLKFVLNFRRPISILVHAGLVVLANVAAFWLRFDGEVPAAYAAIAWELLPWLLVVRLLLFIPFRLFEGLWKYTSLWDLRNIVLAVTASTAAFFPIAVALTTTASVRYPRSIYFVDALLLIVLMTAIRLTRRVYREVFRPPGGRRVLIYGAGDAGELIVRDMRQNTNLLAIPIGFVDDDPSKIGQRIHGVPVLGGRAHLPQIMEAHTPDELLLAIPGASRETIRAIVRSLEPYQIRITTLPRLHDLIDARVEMGQIRQLKVEDLLARDPVGLDYAPVLQFLEGKRILVTGAGGSIGSELCRQIAAANPASLMLLDRYENSLFQINHELARTFPHLKLHPLMADITDVERIDQLFDALRPHVVFHAAAHKHVPLMEDNPCEAVKNNIRGTRILAEASQRCGVECFVLISTDKAVKPTSVMGATKRVAELVVDSKRASTGTRFATVRFGNVLASNGSVVPTFLAQIAKGGPVTVTHPEMKRFFMLIPEAVQLVLHAAALGDHAPLYVLDMGEQLKVVDLARDLIRLSGLVPDKDIEVRFTGMRPGEKLSEELVGEGELTEPSTSGKILCVRTPAPSRHQGFTESLARLEALSANGRSDEVVQELRILLADYSPARVETSPA